jgi:hypothetical protein
MNLTDLIIGIGVLSFICVLVAIHSLSFFGVIWTSTKKDIEYV